MCLLNSNKNKETQRYKVLTVVFWVVAPHGLVFDYQCFGGIYHFHLQGRIYFHNPEDHSPNLQLCSKLENISENCYYQTSEAGNVRKKGTEYNENFKFSLSLSLFCLFRTY
jgi:hypothetical protein